MDETGEVCDTVSAHPTCGYTRTHVANTSLGTNLMPPPNEIQVECQRLASGIVGSAVSLLLHRRDRFWLALTHLVLGAATAYCLGPAVAQYTHLGVAVSGFLAGLFGLAVIGKALDMLDAFDARVAVAELWAALLRCLPQRKKGE